MVFPAARSHRLALAVVVAAIAIAAAALTVAAQRQHYHAIEAERARLSTAAQVVVEHMRGMIVTVDNLLQQVTDDIDHASSEYTDEAIARQRLLTEAGRLLPGVGVIFLLDARGDAVASSLDGPLPRVNFGDREYFKDLAAGHEGLHIGRAIESRLLPAIYFTAARALRGPDGSFEGVVVAGIDIGFAKTFYASLDLGEHGLIGVHRSDGAVVMRHPFDPRILESEIPHDAVGTFATRHLGVIYHTSPIDGVERLVAHRDIAGLPLTVVVGKTAASILAEWRREVWDMASVGGLLLVIMTVPVLMMLRSFRGEAEAHEALRLSNERIGLALRMVPVTLAEMDRDLRYTWIANPVFQIPPENFIGKTREEATGNAGPELDAARREVLRSGRPRHLEAPIRRPDGASRHIDAMIEPRRNINGQIIGLRSAITDITERIEEKLALIEAKAAADKANQAKSRFLAAASHDLRQPLQALRLFLDVLASQLADSPQHVAVARAQEAMTSVERLLATLLDMSRLEAGLVQPEVTTVPVIDLIVPVIRDCEAQAAKKGLRLRWRACSQPVVTDPVLFQRILRNLVVNAIRYTRQGGVLVGCRRRGAAARIEVWDTGTGIPADRMSLIFEEFYRMPETTGASDGGLGLGLSIVERTARLLGHPMAVQSRPGRGTVFAVTLPLAAAAPAQTAATGPM